MPDEKSRGGNSRDNGIQADTMQPEFRNVSADFDLEERLEMAIQKRALDRFRKDDDGFYFGRNNY